MATPKISKPVGSTATSKIPKTTPRNTTGPLNPIPGRSRVAPMQSTLEEKKQAKALDDLMKKRLAVAKKTGVYPNYHTN